MMMPVLVTKDSKNLQDPTGFELQVGVEEINIVCCVKFVMRKKNNA